MKNSTVLAITVAALGYFVDVYDLLLFSVVRVASLRDLGVPENEVVSTGILLLNCQMAGLLIGGILWGILGDKRGRLSVLFGSIILYSVGNILNGFVGSVEEYAILRFITGVGLAGELGAGITLVSELMTPQSRGWGTTIIASVGVCGAIAASLVGDMFPWRISYFIGGGLGLLLLFLRIAVTESGMFDRALKANCKKGALSMLFTSKERFFRYLSCIAVGIPIWFGVGIIITFSPEIGKALHMPVTPSAAQAVFYGYIGLALGDIASGLLSQAAKSRKNMIIFFIILGIIATLTILDLHHASLTLYYSWILILGFALGYWAVFVTSAAEQFGTNLRATVATTAPNFVRGSVIPITICFDYLKTSHGIISSAIIVGCAVSALALAAAFFLKETYNKDLNYLEH